MVTIVGEGTVNYDPPMIAPNYMPGTVVSLTAVPDTGWKFTGWDGDLSGAENPASVTVDAPKSITATFQQTSGVSDVVQIARKYQLNQNYPNPFNPATTITFSLKKSGIAKMELFNLLGQSIVTMFDQRFEAGDHRIRFEAANLPAGVYLYQLTSGDFISVKKMIIMK